MPMGTTGFSDDSGSWKIIARSRPRRSRMAFSGSFSRSVPSNSTVPATLFPRLGSSRMMASEVTDLPQPDSPTRPTVWPGATWKLTPSTAFIAATPRRLKVTVRSVTESSASISASPPALGVDGLAQGLTEQGETQRDDDDGDRRPERQPGVGVDDVLRLAEHLSPFGLGHVLRSQPEEGQRGRVDDRRGH